MSDARKDPEFGRSGENSKQIHGHLSHSEEQLQDELADFMFQATEDELCSERLDALLDALDEVDPLLETEAFDTQKSLDQFHEKYAPVFATLEEKTAETPSSPKKKHSHRMLFRIFPIAAIVTVLIGSVTCQAFGFDIFGTIARWTSEVFQLKSSFVPYATIQATPLDKGEEAYYDTLEDAVDAFGITAPVVPKWIPDRFEIVSVLATRQASGIFICADYASNDGILQIRYKEIKNIDFSNLEQENDDVETYYSGKLKHYFLADMDRQKSLWQNGELECQIAGNVTRQEMREIVDSIYEGA